MRVVPVVLRSTILAGALLLPVAGCLAAAALSGSLGVRLGAVVVPAALLYAVVVWLVARRREAAELAAPAAAPGDARMEPLRRTALRGAGVLLAFAVAGYLLAELFDLLAFALVFAAGVGLAEARVAARFARAERRSGGRLVRGPDGALLRY